VDATSTRPAGVEGLSAEVIHREAKRSLDRLGIDQIDLYWAHADDRATDLAETVQAFGELVEGGVVRRLGASNYATWRIERARRIAADLGVEPWTALQPTTSYLRPRPDAQVEGKGHRFGFLDDETVDYVTEHPEIEIWAYSPLIRGSYDRDDRPFPEAYDHPGTQRRLAALKAVAERLDARPSQVVLAWLMGCTPQVRPIVGVSSLEQLDLAMGATRLDLDDDLRQMLDDAR
jgi:aryl-alcohol dehydrogenase-like predicted oxidoreductase